VFVTDRGSHQQSVTRTADAVIFDLFLAVAGDTDGDRDVDADDIQRILAAAKFNTARPADWTEGDFDFDGDCDADDIQMILTPAKFNVGDYTLPPGRKACQGASAAAHRAAAASVDGPTVSRSTGRAVAVRPTASVITQVHDAIFQLSARRASQRPKDVPVKLAWMDSFGG
jgi:hypothetical protein